METDTMQQVVRIVLLGLIMVPWALLGLSLLNTWLQWQPASTDAE
jgi:hypothetical protein